MRGQSLIQDVKFLKELGVFLRQKRMLSGLSQKDVGEVLGYQSPQYVSIWERGKAMPPLEAIKQLVVLYKIDSEEVMEFFSRHFARVLKETLLNDGADSNTDPKGMAAADSGLDPSSHHGVAPKKLSRSKRPESVEM